MKITTTEIEGVLIVEPRVFGDERGYFMETWKDGELDEALGRRIEFVQDNESMSTRGVLRGLHYQRGEWSQAKLVRVVSGRVKDVAVDLRKGSKTFGRYIMAELSGENHRQLFIPRGFAHGFIVESESATFAYKVDNAYRPDMEATLKYDDAEVGVAWPQTGAVTLSAKDMRGKTLRELDEEGLLF